MLDFPGGLVVKILSFHCRGHRLIPGQGSSSCLGAAKNKKFYIMILPAEISFPVLTI